ncbi:lipid II:glycine glycyltransferase FemX [Brevibacterium sandarakinum]|nr:peptidoglycan bridge formation glycyltransferase FemA/FemB family protein [Brevibacterium sandarakinum]
MYTLRTVSSAAFWLFIDRASSHSRHTVGYQQTPEWATARGASWDPELLGWFDAEGVMRAGAVIRYRKLPGLDRRFAFVPQGPVADWSAHDIDDLLTPLKSYLTSRRVFAVRITPPISIRQWNASTIRTGLSIPDITRLSDLPPDRLQHSSGDLVSSLTSLGWRRAPNDAATESSQPRFNFWLDLAGGDEDAVLASMTKSWRKNIRKSERAGVEVTFGTRGDLADVHRLYAQTAQRNGFSPQPMEYFETMWSCLSEGFPGHFSLHLARHEGSAIAASGTAQVGARAQGVFAATGTERPQAKPSNAVYWAIVRQAIADGAEVFDIGGVDDTLDESDAASGLVRFKADMGADAHEYIGAWDLPIEPLLYAAFTRLLLAYTGASSVLRDGMRTVRRSPALLRVPQLNARTKPPAHESAETRSS